ncbi:hypothetical protein R5R35_007921 [Gryllus longicercus]|uniref:DDE Tnp4 domain-containing protein n=1 Tax=Gryllus longicercus TaxID=2509291 RepID=A0AAN9VGD2_9ORTH
MEEALNFLALCDDEEAFGDFEVALLHNIENSVRNIHKAYDRLDLRTLDPEECTLMFRFEKEHLPRLAAALGVPSEIRTRNRHSIGGVEALCILLRRLAYPNRLTDLVHYFGISSTYISIICKNVMNVILERNKELLLRIQSNSWLHREKFEYYAQAIAAKGCPIPNCWGFIDGTARAICRPSINQEHYYSGHKRKHCLKYQSVLCPDGIIANLQGPFHGRRHDAAMLRDSGLYEQLLQTAVFPDKQYVIYGDSGYPIRQLLLRPFQGRNISEDQQSFNAAMSGLRQSVEWGFAKVVNDFAFIDFKKNQKLLLQDVGSMYKTAVLLSNCHTCLYGSQVGSFFNTQPPSLEEYLNV